MGNPCPSRGTDINKQPNRMTTARKGLRHNNTSAVDARAHTADSSQAGDKMSFSHRHGDVRKQRQAQKDVKAYEVPAIRHGTSRHATWTSYTQVETMAGANGGKTTSFNNEVHMYILLLHNKGLRTGPFLTGKEDQPGEGGREGTGRGETRRR